MPVQPTYPGVYIEEIPSGVRTIVGVATSITAFIGRARRGPVNKYTVINNYGDFERQFGGLWVESRLGYAVRDFYTNGGGRAIIVRVYHDSAGDVTPAQAADAALKAADKAQIAAAALDPIDVGFPAPIPAGSFTDIHNIIEGAKADAAKQLETARAAVIKYLEDKAVKAAKKLAEEQAKNPQVPADINTAQAALNKVITDNATAQTADTLAKLQALLVPADVGAPSPTTTDGYAKLDAKGLTLKASSPGKWGNDLRVRVTKPDTTMAKQLEKQYSGTNASDFFNLIIHDTYTGATESFSSVVAKAGHRRDVAKIMERDSQLAQVDGDATTPTGAHADKPAAKKNIWNDGSTSTAATQDGNDGGDLVAKDLQGSRDKKEGLFALEDADQFNLLYIPPYKDLSIVEQGGDIDADLVDDAEAYCIERRAMLLLDSPTTWSDKDKARAGMAAGETGATSINSAIFFPRLRQPNPERDDQMETFGTGGTIAGIFARTDVQRGVWKAPAGIDDGVVRGAPALSLKLTDAENGELNPLGLNCLRTFPVVGRVVWGSRTSRGADLLASEYKYIPVRRTALFIEESLFRGTQWVVFEPNDERTWAAIRLNVGAFMHDLFKKGAFQIKSSNARDSYFVKCDAETTTQNDINLGIVNIVVGFAPLKPAEFVIIKLQQIVGDIQT